MEIFSPPPQQIDEPLCRVFPVINSEDDVLEQILGEKDLNKPDKNGMRYIFVFSA